MNEGLAVQVAQIPAYRACRGKQGHYQEGTVRPKELSYKRCAEQLGAIAACHAYKQKQKHISVCAQRDGQHSKEPDQDEQLEPEASPPGSSCSCPVYLS